MKAVVALVTAALTVAVVGGSVGAMYPADRTDGSFYAAANGRGAGDCTGPIGGGICPNPNPGPRGPGGGKR